MFIAPVVHILIYLLYQSHENVTVLQEKARETVTVSYFTVSTKTISFIFCNKYDRITV